jgi:hypothetical protein
MAATDATHLFSKPELTLESTPQKKAATMLLKLLQDVNGEVRNQAVKWHAYTLACIYGVAWLLPCPNSAQTM